MSNIPQSPELDQTGMADIAHSGVSTSPTPEGAFVVSPGGAKRGVKARSKTRSAAIPPDAHIAELEKQLDDLFISKEAEIEQWMERCELAEKAAAQAETLERQLETTRKWRDQLRAAELRAKAEAVEWQGKARAAQAQAEQNARIAQEENEERQSILAENTGLRAQVAELEETGASAGAGADVDDLRRQLDAALKRVAHLEELQKFDDKLIRQYQEEKDWQKRLRHNEELEPAHKLALLALREKTYGKGESYTRVYVEDLAGEMGMKRQAAGRRLNELIEYGAFGSYRDTEKATVPDRRLGQREIEKERIHVVATALLERVEDIKRTDGKQHGGYGNRCKKCGAENSLRHVYHTVCLACGHQDVLMPDDAQAAIMRAQAEAGIVEAETVALLETAPALAPAPAPVLVAQVEEAAQVSDVHLEQQSQPAPRSDVMTLARAAGFPALVLADHGVKISAGSAAWSHWTHMERPTNAQLSQVIAHFKGQPEPWDTPCDYCDSTETVWDADGSGRRVTICMYYPERRKPQPWEVQATPAHKAVDFASGGIVEVRG